MGLSFVITWRRVLVFSCFLGTGRGEEEEDYHGNLSEGERNFFSSSKMDNSMSEIILLQIQMSDGVVIVDDSSEKEASDPIFPVDKKESDKTRDDDDSNLTRRMTLVNLEVVSDGNENELSDDDYDDEVIFFLFLYMGELTEVM